MSKLEWGMKRQCLSCSTLFYDFSKNPIVCPKCGETLAQQAATTSRRGRRTEKVTPLDIEDAIMVKGDDDLSMDAEILDEDILEDETDLNDIERVDSLDRDNH